MIWSLINISLPKTLFTNQDKNMNLPNCSLGGDQEVEKKEQLRPHIIINYINSFI